MQNSIYETLMIPTSHFYVNFLNLFYWFAYLCCRKITLKSLYGILILTKNIRTIQYTDAGINY